MTDTPREEHSGVRTWLAVPEGPPESVWSAALGSVLERVAVGRAEEVADEAQTLDPELTEGEIVTLDDGDHLAADLVVDDDADGGDVTRPTELDWQSPGESDGG